MDKYREIIGAIKNPKTGATLDDEGRLKSVEVADGELTIVYNRDDIEIAAKRDLEKEIIKSVAEDFDPFKVNVKTVSSAPPVQVKEKAPEVKQAPEEQAQLKVGHGTIGNKKKVAGVGKVIAVASGKGGVGKSTFTTNLAVTLAKSGLKVGVIDADIYGPSQAKLFGVEDKKPMATPDKKMVPIKSFDIDIMSFAFFIDADSPVIWRGPMLGGVLNQFLFDVKWPDLDVVIIDLPPGTGDIQLSMVQNTHVDGVVVISTPQDVALLDAQKGLNMFKKIEIPILGVVENMSAFVCDAGVEYPIFGKGGGTVFADKMEVDFLGAIPLEMALRESSDAGSPYMSNDDYKDRKVYQSYLEVGSKIANSLGFEEKVSKPKGFFSRLFSK